MPFDDDWDRELRRAVREYAESRFESFARSTIYWLQRLDASNIFDEDYPFKTVWDEYCHYRQMKDHHGDHPLLDWAFDKTVDPTVRGVMSDSKPPPGELQLLHMAASGPWEWYDGIDEDEIVREVRRAMDEKARARSLDRFYAGYPDPRYAGTWD